MDSYKVYYKYKRYKKFHSDNLLCSQEKYFLKKIEKLLDFSDRSSQKKYCGMASANRETASINTAQLYIKININEKIEDIIINLDTTRNFMIRKYITDKRHLI